MCQEADMVTCENCGKQYDRAQGEACPFCKAVEPLETDLDAERRRDMVICENCGKQYDRALGEACPFCKAVEPLETEI